MDKKDWPKHPPPTQLWFQYHPNPGQFKPGDGDNESPAEEGALWEQPYYSKEEAEKAIEREAADDGWEVIGPYTLASPICAHCEGTGVIDLVNTTDRKVGYVICQRCNGTGKA